MIVLSNSIAQTLAPGQSLIFNLEVLHTGCGECYRNGSGSVGLRAVDAVYSCEFRANVASATESLPVQLTLQMSGSPVPETTMISTPSTANAFNNIGCATYISTCCKNGGCGAITVTNTGVNPITVGANPCLRIKRVA